MSIHLKAVTGDETDDKDAVPRKLVAAYQIQSRPGPGTSTSSGKSYWFDAEIVRDTNYRDLRYVAKLSLETPSQPSFSAALAKLAEWAEQAAAGIIECGELPADSFPLEMKAPERDGFGFATPEAADLYGALYDPPRKHEENFYPGPGLSRRDFDNDITYYFVEVPRSGVIVPVWGGTYPAPVYRGKPPITEEVVDDQSSR